MELMEVYHEAMATWIIARVTSGKCEGAAFVFGLIESAIRKEATEILLTPVQELEMVRMDFGRLHCYYRQPEITRAQFAYLAIYLVLITRQDGEIEPLIRSIVDEILRLQQKHPALEAVGFGVPGIIDPAAGVVVNLTNVKGWYYIPLGALVSERIGWLLTWKMTPKRWPTQNGSTGLGKTCPM